jgi:hypothetical protein
MMVDYSLKFVFYIFRLKFIPLPCALDIVYSVSVVRARNFFAQLVGKLNPFSRKKPSNMQLDV